MNARQADDQPRRRRLPVILAGLAFLAILGVALAGAAGRIGAPELEAIVTVPGPSVDAPAIKAGPQRAVERFKSVAVRLARNQTLNQALFSLRLASDEVTAVVDAMKGLFPFRKARPGDQLRLERSEAGALTRFSYRQGAADEWVVERLPDGTLRGAKRPVELTTEVARVAVTIDSSLYEALQGSSEDPSLA